MRRHLLLFIIFALMLPSFAVLLVSGIGILQHEWAIRSVARSYVQEMAENVASRVATSEPLGWGMELSMLGIHGFRVFTWGPSIPGWVAVLHADGRLLFSSPGADIAVVWRPNIPIGRALRSRIKTGILYLAVPRPGRERFVIARCLGTVLVPFQRVCSGLLLSLCDMYSAGALGIVAMAYPPAPKSCRRTRRA